MLLIIGGVSLITSTECSNSNVSDEEAKQVSGSIGYSQLVMIVLHIISTMFLLVCSWTV